MAASRTRPAARHMRSGTAAEITALPGTDGGAAGASIERRQARVALGQPHRRGSAGAEDEPFEQRVAREAVRAVDAGARDLACGEQPGNGGAARKVGVHAAAHVMRRRADGQRIAGEVEPGLAARFGDSRKTPAHPFRVQMAE